MTGTFEAVLAERSIIAEIEGSFASGSADKQADILRRVTDLFLAGADNYSDATQRCCEPRPLASRR